MMRSLAVKGSANDLFKTMNNHGFPQIVEGGGDKVVALVNYFTLRGDHRNCKFGAAELIWP